MTPPGLPFWTQLLTRLAVEAACVVTTAWLLDQLVRPTFWRRALWQGAVVCLLLLTGSELSGFGRGMTSYFFRHPRPEPKPIVLTHRVKISPAPFPPPSSSLPFSSSSSPPLSIMPVPISVPSEAAAPEIIRAVWWPGLLWLAGGLIILGRVAAAQILFISMRRRRLHPACDDLRHRVAAILQRLAVRRKIGLLQSGGLTTPIAFGVLRPSVVLPVHFTAKFTRAEQDAMLAHELAHLAARDPLWYLLADVSSAALWWHPQTWWARRRLHRASELAADEAAALFPQGPAALAECLVTLGRQMTRLPRGNWIGVEGGGFRSNLAERVQRLLHLANTTPQPASGWRIHAAKFGAILAVSAAALTLSGCLQNRAAATPPTLQANLSQSWNTSPAATLWQSVRAPKHREIPPTPELVKVQLVKPEESVVGKTDQVASPVVSTNATIYSQTIRVLESRRIEAQLDYNDHSNTLFILHNLQAQGKLDQGITQVKGVHGDEDLFALSARVSIAQDNLTRVREGYGPESDQYVTAQKAHSEATNTYHLKVMEILTNWESVVEHEKKYLDYISDEVTRYSEAYRSMRATNAPEGPELPELSPYANTNIVYTSAGRQAILAKLQTIKLPKLDFGEEGLPLNEVIRVLKDESRKQDSDGQGINFTYNSHAGGAPPAGAPDAALAVSSGVDAKDITIRISPPLDHLSLLDALDAICQVAVLPPGATGGGLAYTINGDGVLFYIKSPQAVPLYTRTFHVDPNTYFKALAGINSNATPASNNYPIVSVSNGNALTYTTPQSLITSSNNALLRNYFSSIGVNLATNNGTFVFFNDRAGTILVRATAADLETIAQAIDRLTQVPPQAPPLYTRTYREEPHALLAGLQEHFPDVGPDASLSIMDIYLRNNALMGRYFARFGINLTNYGGYSLFNPYTGMILIHATAQDMDSAQRAVEDLAKVPHQSYPLPSPRAAEKQLDEAAPLYTRTFHVDANTNSVLFNAKASTNSTAFLRSFFSAAGINFGTNNGAFIFFNDRAGTILVRATARNLEEVAMVVDLLTQVPPQVQLDVKFAQITPANYKSLGLDLPGPYYIPFDPGTNDNVLQTGLAEHVGEMPTTNPFTVVGVLHNSQFHKIIDAINQIDESALLSCPRVTTESTRQAHLAVSDIEATVARNAVESYSRPIGYLSGPFSFKPAVDILPTVSADGYFIQTVVIPTFSEFLGYENPAAFVPNATVVRGSSIGVPITATLPLPHFRVRQSVVSTNIFDGDTLVLCASLPPDLTINEQKTSKERRNQLIFITPRIIDPAGNPIHTEEQLRLMETPPKPESGVSK
jgi:beta-lactamase regulating signal transducer with metallopeptidase domain